jgi:hypothetical protein
MGMAAMLSSRDPRTDPRLKNAVRDPENKGWIEVHLSGTPSEIGFQHGYLLASEIQDNLKDIAAEMVHDEKKDWEFFRKAAREVLWPKVEKQYREELNGIVDGMKVRGVKIDIWDLVALNAWLELPYYNKWRDQNSGPVAEHCSAFVATGSYTRDGRIVIGHNDWTSYASGERWNIVFDIAPSSGYRLVMDGLAGMIHSGDDFGLNSAGMVITETTISNFAGFDPDGVPEFVRARKAMQYAASIDDFARIMKDGNNGGYANNWLVADSKTNEVADLELGLRNVNLWRTKDGFFVGSNFPVDPKLMQEETRYDPNDKSASDNTRHTRWLALMAEYKGKIDVETGERFLGDHFDTITGKEEASERTLCGHIDLSPRGMPDWQGPYAPVGTVQNKVTDAAGAQKLMFHAALGHACGLHYKVQGHLADHPEFGWYKGILHDMDARGWTEVSGR